MKDCRLCQIIIQAVNTIAVTALCHTKTLAHAKTHRHAKIISIIIFSIFFIIVADNLCFKNVRNSINHLTMESINIISFVQIHCHKMDYFAQQSPRHYLYLYGTTSLCFTAKTYISKCIVLLE